MRTFFFKYESTEWNVCPWEQRKSSYFGQVLQNEAVKLSVPSKHSLPLIRHISVLLPLRVARSTARAEGGGGGGGIENRIDTDEKKLLKDVSLTLLSQDYTITQINPKAWHKHDVDGLVTESFKTGSLNRDI